MVSKLATFREDSDIWERFQAKAKDKGTNASAALQKFVRDYIDDKLDSHIDSPAATSPAAPDMDIKSIVNNAIESRLEAVLSQVEDLRLDLHSIKSNDLITQNLQANLTVAQQRIEALEAIAATTAKLESKLSLEIDKIDIRLKAMPDDLEAKLDPIRAQLVSLESRSEATENSKKPMLSVMRAA